jgi:hypothetical protein
LTKTSFPQLTEVGGTFLIANDTSLSVIGGFPNVQTVGGSIDWTGSFDNASLPSISDVRGGVNVQSSSPTFQCPFPQIRNNGVIKGKGFVCTGNVSNPSSGVNGTNQTANAGSTPSNPPPYPHPTPVANSTANSPSSSSPSTSSPSTSSPSKATGLSNGAIGGIVGGVVGGILAIALILGCLYHKRDKKTKIPEQVGAVSSTEPEKETTAWDSQGKMSR